MRATLNPGPSAGPIQGTFYPMPEGRSENILPRILAVAFAVVLVRTVLTVAKRAGGSSGGHSRRQEAISRFHRELHARDAAEEVTA